MHVVHPPAVEVGADRPLLLVHERVDLLVGHAPVEVPVRVRDEAVERRDRRVDQVGHDDLLRSLTPPGCARAASGTTEPRAARPARRSAAPPRPRPSPTASRADVLQQLEHHLAVRALAPSAHDPAVQPHRRAGVAGAIEQLRRVIAEVPVALLPPHDRGVERREQRRPRLDRPASCRGRRPGRCPAVRPGPPRPRRGPRAPASCRPASTPSTTGGRRSWPDRRTRAIAAPARRGASSTGRRGIPPGSHASTGAHRYCVLLQPPRGPPADGQSIGRELPEDPGGHRLLGRPPLPFAEADLRAQRGDVLPELRRGRLAAGEQRAVRGLLGAPRAIARRPSRCRRPRSAGSTGGASRRRSSACRRPR